jgi:hypothetical protein
MWLLLELAETEAVVEVEDRLEEDTEEDGAEGRLTDTGAASM